MTQKNEIKKKGLKNEIRTKKQNIQKEKKD